MSSTSESVFLLFDDAVIRRRQHPEEVVREMLDAIALEAQECLEDEKGFLALAKVAWQKASAGR